MGTGEGDCVSITVVTAIKVLVELEEKCNE